MPESHASAPVLGAVPKVGVLRAYAVTLGPGLVAMLADTDAGSVMTAAQSGAQFGYGLLLFQLAVIPVMYIAQELGLRLALGTGRGMGELVRARFGRATSIVVTAVLAISCFGALVTQLSGLAAVGQLLDVPAWQTVAVAVAGISVMVVTGSYRSVERISIFFGAFELIFVFAGWTSHPDLSRLVKGIGSMPIHDPRYLYLCAANLGTSVIPWAIFYQQSAAVDKGLKLSNLRLARIDTFVGVLICQIVTSGILMTAAANRGNGGAAVADVRTFAQMFEHALGRGSGALLFGAGLMGSALVATVVVSLASAWAIGEVAGLRHSLEHHPKDAPWFYASFVALLAAGGAYVASGVNLVGLAIALGVLNAMLLPVVLLFLFLLACRELPLSLKPSGLTGLATAILLATTSAVGLYAGLVGAFG
ncbi:NRAMP family divalent metal transporter [Methylovirgula sp. HY1]|uniref:NRAMP family divalent metal transporter n=1 Tax=Methylovirgula sp. HY1 TaxID=2822761 RepID=UPI001C5B8FA9|nr:divalent metal cation transporter [Methylovirgula sp. HY1]QXX76194.1 Divalent metal cation transporter MntH [Methylovirgula sp. HY1]